MNLEVTPSELTGIIDAAHDAILKRLKWSIYPNPEYSNWQTLDIEVLQTVLDGMVAAYTKASMLHREQPSTSTQFEEAFKFPPEIWDLLAAVTTAKTWDDIPKHAIHSPEACKVCCALQG